MTTDPTGGSWKTSAMVRAEMELDEAALRVDEHLARAEQLPEFHDEPLSEQDVARFEQAVRDDNAPDEVKQLARRVDSGEYTWREIAEGKAMRDPEVRAAFAEAGRHVDPAPLQQIVEQLNEGKTPEEIVAANRSGQEEQSADEERTDEPAPRSRRRGRADEEQDDDDYFGGSFMQQGW